MLATFTDLELWHWHAYDYGFRRVFLGISAAQSPSDPGGHWFDSRVVEEAEKWLRAKHRMAPRHAFSAPLRNEIRDDCRSIPFAFLNDLEREFLKPEMDALITRSQAALRRLTTRWRAGVRRAERAQPMAAPPVDVTVKDPALLDQARLRVGL